MSESLIQILFGWPAILLSLGFALAGILLKRSVFSLVGAALILLPAWYLMHYSIIFIILPLFLFGSAYMISRDKVAVAYLLTILVLIVTAGLGILVLTQ